MTVPNSFHATPNGALRGSRVQYQFMTPRLASERGETDDLVEVEGDVTPEIAAVRGPRGSTLGVHAVNVGESRSLCDSQVVPYDGTSDPGEVTCRFCQTRLVAVGLLDPAIATPYARYYGWEFPRINSSSASNVSQLAKPASVSTRSSEAPAPRAAQSVGRLISVPLERVLNLTTIVVTQAEQILRVRREQELVLKYGRYLEEAGLTVARLRLPLEETTLHNDIYVKARHQLIEAKSSARREAIRMAIGQLLDYSFIAEKDGWEPLTLAVLLPELPKRSIVDLLRSQQISVVWETDDGFDDNAGGAFT